MPPESEKCLRNMLNAVLAIKDRVRDHDEAAFMAERGTRGAVTWNLCVIGEARAALKRRDGPLAEQITDARKIIGLRNQLIHGYAVINHQITWEIVTNKVPILRREPDLLLGAK